MGFLWFVEQPWRHVGANLAPELHIPVGDDDEMDVEQLHPDELVQTDVHG